MLAAIPPPTSMLTMERGGNSSSSHYHNTTLLNNASKTTTATTVMSTHITGNQHYYSAVSGSSVAEQTLKPKSSCKRFCPNVFTPNKCQDCYRHKTAHSLEALAENRVR